MKKKLISLALTAAIALSWVPAVSAEESLFDFPVQVANALPTPVPGQLLDNSMDLPDPEGTGFLDELSGPMPAIREDGFLVEPTAPLKDFPAQGELLEEVGAPDPEATPISTAAELQAMTAGGNYVLTKDIDLSGVNWTPVDATGWNLEGSITLDGQGHTISDLTPATAGYGGGLFGQVGIPLTVRNLILKDFSVPSADDYSGVGALAGMTSGSLLVENVVVDNFQVGGTPTLDKNPKIGGLIGDATTSSYDPADIAIRACAVTGKMNCAPDENGSTPFTPNGVGGLVGYLSSGQSASITDCITDFDLDLTSTFTNTYSYFSAGGIVGYLRVSETASLLRCVASGTILGTREDANFSGMVGSATADTSFVMTDCLFDGTLSTGQGGLVGIIKAPVTAIRNCRFEGSLPDLYTNASVFGGIVGRWDEYSNVTSCIIENCLNTSGMTFAWPEFLTSSYASLNVGGMVGSAPAVLTLEGCLNTGDLTVEGDVENCYLGGLVGCMETTTSVHLIRCENRGALSAQDQVGGLVGHQSAFDANTPPVFTDCRNTGAVTVPFTYQTSGYAGGLLGYGSCEMVNCVNTGNISGRYAGGLLGYNERNSSVRFDHCRSTCTLTGPTSSSYSSAAGGLVGYIRCETTLADCAADITVTLAADGSCSYAGGLVGQSESNLSILRCSAVADLPSARYAKGGLVGEHSSSADTILSLQDCYAVLAAHDSMSKEVSTGGLVGCSDEIISADNCAAEVDLTIGPKCSAGGLVGKGKATLARCYATGSIQGNSAADLAQSSSNISKAGGLIGYSFSAALGQCCGSVDIDDCTYMGGLMGDGSGTVYSCWSDATLSGPGTVGYAGGLMGMVNYGWESRYAVQDCTFLGTLSCPGYQVVGSLIGTMDSSVKNGLMYNCYSKGTVQSGDAVGGLVGEGKGSFRSCRFDGTVSGTGPSGGIVGWGTNAGLEFYDCHTTGSVSGGAYVGGIVGNGNVSGYSTRLDHCTSSSSISTCASYSCYLGGLAGRLSGSMTNCRTSGYVNVGSTGTTEDYIGGLVGHMTGTLSNCSVSSAPNISGDGAKTQYLGGLAGLFDGHMVDCTSLGIHANRRGATTLYAGGLFGSVPNYTAKYTTILDNCRVEGSVFANAVGTQTSKPVAENVYLGGLYGKGVGFANGCSVVGNVTLFRTLSPSATGGAYAGGYVGSTGSTNLILTVDNCLFDGVRVAPNNAYSDTQRLLQQGKLQYAKVPEVVLPEEEDETYAVTVKLMDYETPAVLSTQAGIPVTVNGVVVGTTDENGVVKFGSDKVKSGSMVKISAHLDGYFDSTVFTYLADGGSTLLVLKQLQPGQVYIKSARYLEEGSSADLLSYLTDLRILEIDDNFKKVRFEAEWGDSLPQTQALYLADEAGNRIFDLHNGEYDYVQFSKLFEPDTDIYVVAHAAFQNEDGSFSQATAKELLSIRVETIRPPVSMQGEKRLISTGSDEKADGPYFLKGLEWGLGADDIGPFAAEMSLKNGFLQLKFNAAADLDYKIPMFATATTDGQASIGLEGELSIPYVNTYTEQWDGDIYVTINEVPTAGLDPEEKDENSFASIKMGHSSEDKGLFNLKYDFLIPIPIGPYVIPCFFDTVLDVGGKGGVHFHGPWDKIEAVEGKLDFLGYCNIFAGVGGEVDDVVAVKFGGEGELNPEISLTFSNTGSESGWLLHGSLSAKALIKFLEEKIEAKLRLGGFSWDGETTTWYSMFDGIDGDTEGGGGGFSDGGGDGGGGGTAGGRSIQILEDTGDCQPLSRSYLANGGGFATQDISTFAFSSTGGNLRYDNIGEVSEAALTVENDTLVLYFTADDGAVGTTGSVGSHTVVWRSELLEDGSWSAPTVLTSAEDGFPAAVHADGPYAAWEQSSDTTAEDITALLTSTDIQVAVNGENVHTFEMEGYDYAPKVSADGDYGLVCWLHDPSFTDETDNVQLWYATYYNGVWSDPVQMNTVAPPVSFFPDYVSNYIYYRTADGTLYRQATSNWSSGSAYRSGLSGRTAVCRGMAASFDEDGTLTIRNESSTVTRSTGYIRGQDVAMVYSGSTYYLFWPEAEGVRMMTGNSSNTWGEPILLAATGELPEQLSAAVVNGVPYASWYQRSVLEDGTHKMDLYTACADPNGVDLVLQTVKFNREELMETGKLTIQGDVYNAGMAAVDSITVTIHDGEEDIYTRIISTSVAPGATTRFNATIAPSTTATTYTVTVTPAGTDTDPLDNALVLAFDDVSARIMDASFLEGVGGVELQALVRNDGLLPLTDLKVEVSDPSGAVLTSTAYGDLTDVPVGSYRQVVLADAQPDTYYTVTVSSGDTVLDSTMLRYDDPNAVTLAVTQLEGKTSGEVSLRLSGQNHADAAKQLMLALYQDEQMAACGLADVSSLNGKQTVTFQLGELKKGSYDYKLFFLSNDANLTPYTAEKSGTVQISP